ncbi:hypothetical protein [Streptococcus uberis]|uniref:hypothetical protein n=1 Tax=Streptococcus uberis TaxID=1349 RepID=UPI00062045F9|nr:hypothetical protein [Streptococcus uberis]KKF57496.1 hypothetical protein AF68_00365 [Streptococcus uberis B362]
MKTVKKADLLHFLGKEVKKIKHEIDKKESNLFDSFCETCRISFFINSNRIDLDVEIYNDFLFQSVNENYIISTFLDHSNIVVKKGFIGIYKYILLYKRTSRKYIYLNLEKVNKIEIIKATKDKNGYEEQKVLGLKRVRQKYKVSKYKYRFYDNNKFFYN